MLDMIPSSLAKRRDPPIGTDKFGMLKIFKCDPFTNMFAIYVFNLNQNEVSSVKVHLKRAGSVTNFTQRMGRIHCECVADDVNLV